LLLTPFFFVQNGHSVLTIHSLELSLLSSTPTKRATITSLQLILNYFDG